MLKLRQLQEQKKKLQQEPLQTQQRLSAGRLRLQKDLKSWTNIPGIELRIIKSLEQLDSLPLLELSISPNEGFYAGGHFIFHMEFKETYPIEPPNVSCQQTIFHPNIDIDGKICLNVLREDWSPALDLSCIIYGLSFLFLECSHHDPLNKNAAALLISDKNSFATHVKKTMAGYIDNGVVYNRVV